MFNIILEQVPPTKIGMMMGVGTMIPAIAPAIGPTFGGIVVTSLGWRYIFILLVPVMVISLVIGLLTIEQKSEVQRTHFDFPSLFAIAIMFIGTIFGFSNMGSSALLTLQVGGAFVVGIAGLIGLIIRSRAIKIRFYNLVYLKIESTVSMSFLFYHAVSTDGLGFHFAKLHSVGNGSTAQFQVLSFSSATLGALFTPLGGRI
jgi:predicted MFS family arabinose efflux permease